MHGAGCLHIFLSNFLSKHFLSQNAAPQIKTNGLELAKISIIGSGSWGTALALVLARNHHKPLLYGRDAAKIAQVRESRQNRPYLPDVKLPAELEVTANLAAAVEFSSIFVLAVPSQAFRAVLEEIVALGPAEPFYVVSTAKGLEKSTLLRMGEVTAQMCSGRDHHFVCLSGPSHAEEVARDIPTTVVAASLEKAAAQSVQDLFMTPRFRVYSHHDVIGVETGGALKNIIALAAGICDGVGFGDNTKAALITRGLVEITRLGVAMGADPMTFAGLSGMGDLIVTCMSKYSRNRHFGEQIGQGKSFEEVLGSMQMVAEGVWTTKAAHQLARRHGIEMPIADEVYAVLFENKSPKKAVAELMTRQAKAEAWG